MTTPISQSKMGVHLETVWNEAELYRLAKSGARIFVVLNEFKYAQIIHNECPDALIFFRQTDLGDWMAQCLNDGIDPNAIAAEWLLRMTPYRDAMPWAVFIGMNEYNNSENNLDVWRRFAALEKARINQGYGSGFKVAFGGFGVSHPKNECWANFKSYFAPVFAAANAINLVGGTAIYHCHEYSSGIMSLYYGPNTEINIAAGVVDPFPLVYTEGDLVCHYRKVYREMIEPLSYDIQIAITEWGNDYIESAAAHTKFGTTGGWSTCVGALPYTDAQSVQSQLVRGAAWYDAQIRADPYLLGATPFTWNINGWDSFRMNYDEIEIPYLEYLAHPALQFVVQGTQPPAPTPDPTPTPSPVGVPPFRGRVKAGVRLNFRQDANANSAANIWFVLDGSTEFEIWQSAAYVKSVQSAGAGWICVKIGSKIGFLAFSYCELL